MHTSGQPFVMSFQAGGPHAQDRAFEAIIGALVEQERVPASVIWEKPGKEAPIRVRKDYRIVPRGVALVIGCNTFPTWNAYPRHLRLPGHWQRRDRQAAPRAVLPLAISVEVARKVLRDNGFRPGAGAAGGGVRRRGLAKTLAERPRSRSSTTPAARFGGWLEREGQRPASSSTPRSPA
jgi:hypothetical protein